MKVYQLIEKLKQLPKNYDVRIDYNINIRDVVLDDLLLNYWVNEIELHKKGSSGYEDFGEVVILGSE